MAKLVDCVDGPAPIYTSLSLSLFCVCIVCVCFLCFVCVCVCVCPHIIWHYIIPEL
jgi:hypothetical protein